MSSDPPDEFERNVDDDEGLVDRRIKERMLNNRERVDEWKADLFSRAKMGVLSHQEATALWRDRVVEYLLVLEPILRTGELPNSEEVYLKKPLGSVVLEPPEEYQVSGLPGRDTLKERDFEMIRGEPPEPVEKQFRGLKDAIEKEAVRAEWEFEIVKLKGPGRPNETKQIEETKRIPKGVLENAVRVADTWLQNVGIGLSIGTEYHGDT